MTILKLECDNFYMFKNLSIDFTYPKKVKSLVSHNDCLLVNKKINVKKNLIILGANASGKTTFSKMLCGIVNYIRGRDMKEGEISFKNAIYDQKKEAYFRIEFVIENIDFARIFNEEPPQIEFIVSYEVFLTKEGIVKEKIYFNGLDSNISIKKARESLYEEKNLIATLPRKIRDDGRFEKYGFRTYLEFHDKEKAKLIKEDISYYFSFSDFFKESDIATNFTDKNRQMLEKILTQVDNSVSSIKTLQDADNKKIVSTYIICFKNGEELVIPKGDISQLRQTRLSHGTMEAIAFSYILVKADSYNTGIIFIDEQLSHMHSELERYLIMRLIRKKDKRFQFFYTTHNTDCLDLNLPSNCFLFFKRNKDGYNEIVHPEETFNKNDRSMHKFFVDDYFDTEPDFSALDEVFEEY